MALKPGLPPPAGGHRSQPQHLSVVRQVQPIQLQLPVLDAVGAIGSKGSEGIGQQRPTAEVQPAMQRLLKSLQRGRKTAPRARNHNPRALWIEARRRRDLGRRLRESRGRERS